MTPRNKFKNPLIGIGILIIIIIVGLGLLAYSEGYNRGKIWCNKTISDFSANFSKLSTNLDNCSTDKEKLISERDSLKISNETCNKNLSNLFQNYTELLNKTEPQKDYKCDETQLIYNVQSIAVKDAFGSFFLLLIVLGLSFNINIKIKESKSYIGKFFYAILISILILSSVINLGLALFNLWKYFF